MALGSEGSSSKGNVAGELAPSAGCRWLKRAGTGGLISRVGIPESWEDKLWLSWFCSEQWLL